MLDYEFPEYSADKYGFSLEMRQQNHQNCCECSTIGCSARKCCSGTDGANCTCLCKSTWWGGYECGCSNCIIPGIFETGLTRSQFQVWKEFNDILSAEKSNYAESAKNELLGALSSVAENDEEGVYNHKTKMGEYLPNLASKTKLEINKFLDKYEFEDERL